jgi:hypothetical protein
MSEVSAVLALPYIQPAQAQKHVTHNEALRLLDVIVQLAVADRTRTAAPASPEIGARHIVAAGAVGEWAGQDRRIAVFDIEGWVFFTPLPGWRAQVLAENTGVVYSGTAWVAQGEVPQTVTQIGVNTSSDATNRLAVSSTATLLTHAGNGHQLKINKSAQADTASLLFQTNFSGRAEMGLAGNDEFSVKVSADGATFAEGLRVGPGGRVTLPNGALVPDGTAGAPGLRFAAETGTGLTRPSANTMGLVTGGVQRATLSNTTLRIDVPVTGTAAQTGSHDATAGRLARVFASGGMFGWGVAQGGSLGAVVAAANGVTIAGLYRTDTTTTNLPVSASSGLLEVFHGAGGDTIHQRWTATTADSAARSWQRRASGGTWTAWALVFNQSTLLGPVSQSAGLPTGAVIERGSGANGEFVRFADGTQICTRTNLSAANASTASGSLFRSADVAWTFPAAFAAAPVVSGAVDDIDAWLTAGAPSVTAVNLRVMSSVTKAAALSLRAQAVGRWF